MLEGFLSELLFDDIRIKNIIESEANQEDEDNKYNRVDILTENSKNELIIIEIQNSYDRRSLLECLKKTNKKYENIDFFHRMNYGTAKSISENLQVGQKYSEIKKVISINIIYFELGQGEDYIYKGITDFKGIHQHDVLNLSDKQKTTFQKRKVSDIFPEYYLLKVNQFNDVAKDTLDEWIYFLKNSEVKDTFKAKGLKEAREVLDIMRLNKDDKYGYNRHLDSLSVKASELFSMQTEAEFKIKDERSIEIAKIGILKGLDNKIIADLTGLTFEQIENLRTKMKK